MNAIGVLGAGPVGSILAANFAKVDQPVVLIDASEKRREQITTHGLRINGKDDIHTDKFTLIPSIEELTNHPVDTLFICVKTWVLKRILPDLSRVLGPETLVVAYQNGIGPEDELAEVFPESQVARGIANFAGGISPDNGTTTMHWFNPPNYIGPMDEEQMPRVVQLTDLCNRAGLISGAISNDEMKKLAFFKTILNSALNALCATSGITMRQAMTYPHTRHLATQLLREGLTVAAAVGYNYGEDALRLCLKYLDAGGDHMPSMWTDLELGTPTEIEYINGKIAQIGKMFKGMDVSTNLNFTAAIITREITSGVRDPDDIPDYLTGC